MSDPKNAKEHSPVVEKETAVLNEASSIHSVHSSTTIYDQGEGVTTTGVNVSHDHEKLDVDHDHVHLHDPNHAPPGHGESAIPADKQEEEIENLQDDWEDDPINARNWSFSKKWSCVAIVSLYTFLSPLSSSMLAPGLPDIAAKYGVTSTTETSLMLSVFLISFAFGPLLLAPLSEMYGRTWVLHFGTFFSLAFNLGCAFAPNAGAFIGFRFLNGFSGSAPIACGGGSIGDLFSERDRASAMAIYSLGPLIGPAVGPVAGGFIAQTIGPKYVFIVIAAACGVSLLIGIPVLKETYAPVIRSRRIRAEGDTEKAKHFHGPISDMGKWEYLWLNLSRPVILLSRSFICFILSLYMAFMYGIYYLMFTTFPELFNVIYGFDTGTGGLVYLGLGIGFLIATMFGAKTADQIYHHLSAKNGGKGKPEMRIPALAFGSLWVPVGLFWYGWSAQAQIHWIMPIIGSGIFGFGMMTTFLPIQLYLVDAFQFAASALAAAAVLRSLLGFAFPLFGTQMYNALGYGGGNSLLGGLAIVLGIPFPIWIYYKGEEMRARNALTRS
ncbi:multidrug resistance protein 4 [Lentinula aff. detonsa]|uniref:Multidrug resistance protein 4 n=1 Tax=Lentinula aff. detonsa TaxID=2804958 RepID=A0AA38KV53_9AGAR|nr:multidrug resistance protein 4 [Lentinula aff. detonsa]KAJ3798539.1 multidrug resistance protein 4 [Lentinula aff. detonsa]